MHASVDQIVASVTHSSSTTLYTENIINKGFWVREKCNREFQQCSHRRSSCIRRATNNLYMEGSSLTSSGKTEWICTYRLQTSQKLAQDDWMYCHHRIPRRICMTRLISTGGRSTSHPESVQTANDPTKGTHQNPSSPCS